MKFCDEHWSMLRTAIDDRGLGHLVSQSGDQAAARITSQLELGQSQHNFDPLVNAHFAIISNVMKIMSNVGINPLYLFNDQVHAPEGRNDCPLCEMNWLHRDGCVDPRCVLDKERGYDRFIGYAADEQLQEARRLKLVGLPS